MAKLKIRFVNFDRSPALETYTQKHIASLVRRIDRRPGESKSIEVQFKLDARAPLGTIKNSEVMISYKYPDLKKVLHVKRTGTDLRQVLVEAIRATETAIQKASEKMEHGRRKVGRSQRNVREFKKTLEQEQENMD